MGKPKALLPWLNCTLLEYQLIQLSKSNLTEIVLVLGHRASIIKPYATGYPRVKIVENPDYRKGRSSSVICGLSALNTNPLAILVLNVDQPRPSSVINQIINAHFESMPEVTIPIHQGHRGHPTIFNGNLIEKMKAITEKGHGLRAIVAGKRVKEVNIPNPIINIDLNTPEDYKQALNSDL